MLELYKLLNHKTKSMKIYILTLLFLTMSCFVNAQAPKVQVKYNENGIRLSVDEKDFMIRGMNWDYYPIGTNYTYSLWSQPENSIKSALDYEMTLLKNMGVNTLRIYEGIPKKWIEYIYKNYGIYTVLNHTFGRYGLTVDGEWMANTEYGDERVQKIILEETTQLAKEYKDTPGLLFYLLGNENNYGLFWEGAETEDIPEVRKESLLRTRAMYKLFLLKDNPATEKTKDATEDDNKSIKRAKAMYKLFNKAALALKAIDSNHPVAMCNGDLMFMDIIKEECNEVDIFGVNMYRGISFGDTFQRVKQALGKPMMFTEFGADAYNAIEQREDQESQAYYILGNWKEIYTNVAGIGGAGNSIGGFTFQFSDGWWKVNQTENLDVHDTNASWSNGGYYKDQNGGKNNINEEWFGICAKGKTDAQGLYTLYPRAAYFVLKEVHKFFPFTSTATLIDLEKHFSKIQIDEAMKKSTDHYDSLLNNRNR